MPTVSIIMPFYKGEQYIRATLDSVKAQTFQDWELLCIDDVSPDGSAAIVKEYAASDPRFVYIAHEKNAGAPAVGRNTGLKAAKGTHISFIDHDDLWEPNKLEDQLKAMEEQKVAYLCSNIYLLNNQTGKIDGKAWGKVDTTQGRGMAKRLLEGNFVPPASSIALKKTFDEVGGFDPAIKGVDDYDMWYRIVRKFPSGVLDIPHASWRYANEQSLSADEIMMIQNEITFYEKILALPDCTEYEKEMIPQYIARDKKLMANRYLYHGKYTEAKALYKEIGFTKMLTAVRLAPGIVRALYRARAARKQTFAPLDVIF